MMRSLGRLLNIGLMGLGVLLSCPSRAQDRDTPPPPPPAPDGNSQPTPKSWYPRLTGLPVQPNGDDTFTLAGEVYSSRTFLVVFFEGTSSDKIQSQLNRFPLERLQAHEDGRTFDVTLSTSDPLFPALDTLNDQPEVQGAQLIRFSSGGQACLPPP